MTSLLTVVKVYEYKKSGKKKKGNFCRYISPSFLSPIQIMITSQLGPNIHIACLVFNILYIWYTCIYCIRISFILPLLMLIPSHSALTIPSYFTSSFFISISFTTSFSSRISHFSPRRTSFPSSYSSVKAFHHQIMIFLYDTGPFSSFFFSTSPHFLIRRKCSRESWPNNWT